MLTMSNQAINSPQHQLRNLDVLKSLGNKPFPQCVHHQSFLGLNSCGNNDVELDVEIALQMPCVCVVPVSHSLSDANTPKTLVQLSPVHE